jgi:hypothetical protein
MNYDIQYFRPAADLTADERGFLRKNARGLWLTGGQIEAGSPQGACAAYRRSGQVGSKAPALRAKPVA